MEARQLAARVRHELWLRTLKRAGPLQRWLRAPDPAARGASISLPRPAGAGLERAREISERWRAGKVSYLAQEGDRDDWRGLGKPKLWRYERQYHRELVALAAAGFVKEAHELVERWARACPPAEGDAWEPYPVARRVLSWAEAMALEPLLREALAPRLAPQLRFLRAHLEWHLLGNHLITDAAALVAGGAALEGGLELAEFGARLLVRELGRQVLPDGGYAERAPLYHALVTRDALLSLALARQRGLPLRIDAPAARMLRWLGLVRRDGGALPCLNDSTAEAALFAREAMLRGLELELLDPGDGAGHDVHLPDTGWSLVREGRHELLFEHGPIGPAEQPGHGHSDALSFELFWDGAPAVLDTGVSTYEVGPQRAFERSARAHATVTVDGEGPDELWASFRVGGRGTVRAEPPQLVAPDVRVLRASVRAARGWLHERTLVFRPGRALVVLDDVKGARPGAAIVARLTMAPGFARPGLGAPDVAFLHRLVLRGEAAGEEPGSCATGFGELVPRRVLLHKADERGRLACALIAPGVEVALEEGHVRIDGVLVSV